MDQEYITIDDIGLAWNGEVDKNNRLFSRDEMNKALNRDEIKEKLETGNMLIECPYQTYYHDLSDFCVYKPEFVVGNVISVDLDNRKATIKIKKDIDITNCVLAFSYLGTVNNIDGIGNVEDIRIIKAGIILKELVVTNESAILPPINW